MTARPDPPLPARYYALLGGVLLDAGVRLPTLLRRARVPARRLLDPEGQLRLSEVERLSRSALALRGSSELGLELGAAIEPTRHAVLGRAMLEAPCLDAALRLAARYFALLSPGFRLRYAPGSERAEVWIHPRLAFSAPVLGLHLDSVLVAFCRELDFLHGRHLRPLDGSLSTARPQHVARYRALLGWTPRFDAEALPGIRLQLPMPALLAPRRSDSPALALARARCEALLAEVRAAVPVTDWTAMMLREVQGAAPRQDELAGLLAISSRHFARQLRAEGSTYRQLLEQVRMQRARAALTTRRGGITELALQLGYQDAANFSRAFRRHHGCAPRQWRETPEPAGATPDDPADRHTPDFPPGQARAAAG